MLLLIGIGFDGDADISAETDVDAEVGHGNFFFKVLSLKTLVAFFTFFGLTGLYGKSAGWDTQTNLVVSILAGFVAILIVAYLWNLLLSAQGRGGSIDLKLAIGSSGRVYLRVPASYGGRGKVTVIVHKRSVQAKAVTGGPEISTGTEVEVVGMRNADTLEVQPLRKEN